MKIFARIREQDEPIWAGPATGIPQVISVISQHLYKLKIRSNDTYLRKCKSSETPFLLPREIHANSLRRDASQL
jgi:hypothetical protein